MRELMTNLAAAVRKAVLGQFGSRLAKMIVGKGASGDAQYGIDQVAEQAVEQFMEKQAPNIASFTEDKGLMVPDGAETIFIIDPIDGTRAAAAGLESCCVSIAAAPFRENEVCLSDVTRALIMEIKEGGVFWAEKDCGLEIVRDEKTVPITLSDNIDFEKLYWEVGYTGRPASFVMSVLANLIDDSTVQGGYFTFNSVCYAGTRVLTGQLDAVVDLGTRIYREIPDSRKAFLRAGKGEILGQFPYDLAALNLLCNEAGAVITDSYGRDLGDMKLLDTSSDNLRSCVVTATQELHNGIMAFINSKFRDFEDRVAEYRQMSI